MCDEQPQPATGCRLDICSVCRADFVVPVTVEAVEGARWHLLLRCGECQTYRDVVVTKGAAERYEADWERGVADVAAEHERVEHERMATDVEILIVALERDLIDAADFARG
jgi:hypothetical protein